MTALKKYQRLESRGLWRDTPDAQRREVVVSFGEASLILSDPRMDVALSHWSLPAVERANPGHLPAVYAPGPDAPETLELDDPEMIAALEKVHGALAFARARPGRVRLAVLLGSLAVVIGLTAWVGPGQLVDQTTRMVPEGARVRIGQAALGDLARIAGQPCANAAGQGVLDRLSQRLFGGGMPWSLRVLPDGVPGAVQLPGHLILLNRTLVEGETGPEALAGFALAEMLRAGQADALEPLLAHAGLGATVGLMTSGILDANAIAGYGEALLRAPVQPLEDTALLAAFQAAKVPTSPYAYALDRTGETTLGLIEADPFQGKSPEPLMSDTDWAALQAICKG
jgi:hypothetical protein